MKCVICHGEDIREGLVNEELTLNGDVIYVPVTVPVCKTCGERYYDRRTMGYLEDVARELKAGKAPLKDVGRVRLYGRTA